MIYYLDRDEIYFLKGNNEMEQLTVNRRYIRTQHLMAEVMNIIHKRLREHAIVKRDDIDNLIDTSDYLFKDLNRDLFELFMTIGVEVVTDAMRAEAGLALRNEDGMTLEELNILENKRILSMMAPIILKEIK